MKSFTMTVLALLAMANAAFAEAPTTGPTTNPPVVADKAKESLYKDLESDPVPDPSLVITTTTALCINAQTLLFDRYVLLYDSHMIKIQKAWVDKREMKKLVDTQFQLWAEVEAHCTEDVLGKLSVMYIEWSTKQHKPPPEFIIRKEQAKNRAEMEKNNAKFAAAVRAKQTYVDLLKTPEGKEYVSNLPNLEDPFFNHTKLKTSVEDARVLDETLGEVKKAVVALPPHYQEMFHQLNLYVAMGSNDLKVLCQWEYAGACYYPQTKTMYILPAIKNNTPTATMAHELTHALHDHLGPKRNQFEKTLAGLVSDHTAQADTVKDRNYVLSWQDKSIGPRYIFVRPYGASNAWEHAATYCEDLFTNGANLVVKLLQTEQRRGVVRTLNALDQAGFLGPEHDNFLTEVYKKAGLGKEAVTMLQ